MAQRERTIFSIHDGTALTGMVAEDVVLLEIVQEHPRGLGWPRALTRTPIVVSLPDLIALTGYLAEEPTDKTTDEPTDAEE